MIKDEKNPAFGVPISIGAKVKNSDLKPKLAGECWRKAPRFPIGGGGGIRTRVSLFDSQGFRDLAV